MECPENYKYDPLFFACIDCHVQCDGKAGNQLSHISKAEVAGKLHNLVIEIKKLESSIVSNFFRLGGLYKKIKEEKLWKLYGESKTFELFCENELNRSRETVNSYIRIYEKFFPAYIQNQNQIPDLKRLLQACPLIENEQDAETWYHEALVQTSEGWRNAIAVAKNRLPSDECDHAEVMLIERCKLCGKTLEVR